MTRINADLAFRHLSDQLLNAELGEITRIFPAVLNRIESNNNFDDIPAEFTLGEGHAKFFYNKIDFILDRYTRLRAEYKRRTGKEYSIKHLKEKMLQYVRISRLRPELRGWYVMTPRDEKIILDRIQERQRGYKTTHTFYGEPVEKHI